MAKQDKAANTADKIKGKAKQAAGRMTGKERIEGEGKSDEAKADIKQTGEKAKDAFTD